MNTSDNQDILNRIRNFFEKFKKINEYEIKSIYIINSLARNDFIKGVSDIDLLIIFEKTIKIETASERIKKISSNLNTIFSKFNTSHFGNIIDIAWEIHDNYTNSPLKCFKYFFDDLKNYHIHIYGSDILDSIDIQKPTKTEYHKKIKELIKKYNSHTKLRQKNLDIGEIIRYYLKINNVNTLNKYEILKKLDKSNHKNIIKFYEKYIGNNTDDEEQKMLNEKILKEVIAWQNKTHAGMMS